MTTFKGFVRSTNATLHRLERAAERRAREAAKQEKLRLKAEQRDLSYHAVETYNEVIASLTAAHKEPIELIYWQELLQEPRPTAPTPTSRHEQTAQAKLNAYRPTFFGNLFKTAEGKKQRLQKDVEKGRHLDQQTFDKASAEYSQQHQEWLRMQGLAKGVLDKNVQAYQEAMERFNPFAETREISAPPKFTYHPDHIEIHWFAHTEEVVPHYVLSLTSTGKLSKKDMAASRVHELYQDHICSYLLRAGREVLALLPVEFAVIHVLTDLVDPATGRMQQQPILSCILYPETLAKLNFELLDTSEAMKNFKHHMQFSKTSGFKTVEKLTATATGS